MQRRELLVGGGTAAAAALAGCLGAAQESDQTASDGPRTITVEASGRVEAEPDLAVIEFGIEATGDSAESVRADVAERSEAVRDALLEFGLDEDSVTTGRFDVRRRADDRRGPPDESGDGDGDEPDVYYEGLHSLTVELADVDRTGAVIDTAVAAGADSVGGVRFTLSEDTRAQLRERALGEALEDARSEAEFVASDLDASIVEARAVDTAGGGLEPVRTRVAADAAVETEAATELHPDDVTVSATVVVEYEME